MCFSSTPAMYIAGLTLPPLLRFAVDLLPLAAEVLGVRMHGAPPAWLACGMVSKHRILWHRSDLRSDGDAAVTGTGMSQLVAGLLKTSALRLDISRCMLCSS